MAALGTRLLKIKIGAVEYTAEVSAVEIVSGAADSDFTSFADAAAGGAREYALTFTARQDLTTGTLWRQVWTAAGTTVAIKLAPYGNAAAATVAEPHFTANAVITEPDGTLIGGEAKSSTSARMTFACRWVLTAKPVEVTTGAF